MWVKDETENVSLNWTVFVKALFQDTLCNIMIVLIFCQSDTLIPQIVGFHFTKILQSGEVSLITSNLRKTLFSIEITMRINCFQIIL